MMYDCASGNANQYSGNANQYSEKDTHNVGLCNDDTKDVATSI